MDVLYQHFMSFCRLHLALKAYTELLQNLNLMDRSKDEAIKNSAQVIKGKLIKSSARLHAPDVIIIFICVVFENKLWTSSYIAMHWYEENLNQKTRHGKNSWFIQKIKGNGKTLVFSLWEELFQMFQNLNYFKMLLYFTFVGNVFYMMEYRDIFVILLRKFDETRQSRWVQWRPQSFISPTSIQWNRLYFKLREKTAIIDRWLENAVVMAGQLYMLPLVIRFKD